MASLSKQGKGRWRVGFVDLDGKRRTLWLRRVQRKQAEVFRLRVDQLEHARINGMSQELTDWLNDLLDRDYARLVKQRLVNSRDSAKLGEFTAGYIENAQVKKSTKTTLDRARKDLIECFGAERSIRSIEPADARRFAEWLAKRGSHRRQGRNGKSPASSPPSVAPDQPRTLSIHTVRRTCGKAKQMFAAARREKIITVNPFIEAEIVCAVGTDESRRHFIEREVIQAVIDACPDDHWRLLFALARYTGLRIPSEVSEMEWGDIHWEKDRFWVRSPKTAHHEGGGGRWVPLLPDVRALFTSVSTAAEAGATRVFPNLHASANLRTQAKRIIRRAGVTPWAKLWVNLRSTAATEMVARHGVHLATAWLGHSALVANKHYWQVRDQDYTAAAQAESRSAFHSHQETRNEEKPSVTECKPLFGIDEILKQIAQQCISLHAVDSGNNTKNVFRASQAQLRTLLTPGQNIGARNGTHE